MSKKGVDTSSGPVEHQPYHTVKSSKQARKTLEKLGYKYASAEYQELQTLFTSSIDRKFFSNGKHGNSSYSDLNKEEKAKIQLQMINEMRGALRDELSSPEKFKTVISHCRDCLTSVIQDFASKGRFDVIEILPFESMDPENKDDIESYLRSNNETSEWSQIQKDINDPKYKEQKEHYVACKQEFVNAYLDSINQRYSNIVEGVSNRNKKLAEAPAVLQAFLFELYEIKASKIGYDYLKGQFPIMEINSPEKMAKNSLADNLVKELIKSFVKKHQALIETLPEESVQLIQNTAKIDSKAGPSLKVSTDDKIKSLKESFLSDDLITKIKEEQIQCFKEIQLKTLKENMKKAFPDGNFTENDLQTHIKEILMSERNNKSTNCLRSSTLDKLVNAFKFAAMSYGLPSSERNQIIQEEFMDRGAIKKEEGSPDKRYPSEDWVAEMANVIMDDPEIAALFKPKANASFSVKRKTQAKDEDKENLTVQYKTEEQQTNQKFKVSKAPLKEQADNQKQDKPAKPRGKFRSG